MENENKETDKAQILIIDDVEINRAILEEIIEDMGCCPVMAESGEQALKLLHKVHPQLILTDISMPGMNGYELCKILKSNKRTRNIPVIFISAFSEPKDIVEGFVLGGEDYITKPFIPEVVQARVGVHLRLHEARHELTEMNRKLQISVNEQLKQMETEKKNILYALANIAAQNADYEEKHIERIKNNCRIIAQGMQLSPLFEDKISDTDIDTIELAAPLCDIGNIGIPMEILQKKAELTEEETVIIQKHPKIGAQLLEELYRGNEYNDFIGIAADVIRHHHENWDGSGYPDRLKQDGIPLAAQIVSIMERYTALTEDMDCSREAALAALEKDAGVTVNPDIFDICFKISRQLY